MVSFAFPLLLILGTVVAATPPAMAQDDPEVLVLRDVIELRTADGTAPAATRLLAIDTALRRLVVTTANGEQLLVDIDTGGVVRRQTTELRSTISAVALDDRDGHHVFFAGGRLLLGQDNSSPAISTTRIADNGVPLLYRFAANYAQQSVAALSYYAPENRVYAVTTGSGVQVTVHALDASLLASSDSTKRAGALIWSKPVDACAGVPGGSGAPGFVGRGDDFLYFFCTGLGGAGLVQAYPAGAYRIDLSPALGAMQADTANFTAEFFPISADLTTGLAQGDQAGNRLVVAAASAGTQKVFVFDARHRSWTGSIPLGKANIFGAATNPKTGRIYVLQQSVGVLITEGAALPTPSGKQQRLRDESGAIFDFSGSAPTVVDPKTGRLFVTRTAGQLFVYEDLLPRFVPPEPDDPDDATSDVEEGPDTTVTFTGEASAFGARVLAVGGLGATAASFPLSQLRNIDGAPVPSDGDRDLFLGWSPQAQLTGDERGSSVATADAIAIGVDKGTQSDLANFPRPPEGVGAEPASCSSAREGTDGASQRGATTDCRIQDDWASARATTEVLPSPSPVEEPRAWSDVVVRRDPERGFVARAEARATGITIALEGLGSIRIGEVHTIAESVAKGGPGSARSTFEPTVNQVRIEGPDGATVYACDTCDPLQVAAAINRIFPARVKASAPAPDDAPWVFGSSAGATAAVVKEPYAFWSRKNTNNDDRFEVAALEIIVFHDQQSASREIIQLGGVLTSSRYTVNPTPVESLDPASLAIELLDGAGETLAGGMFEVTQVDDSLEDSLGTGELIGACVTDTDGTGDCTFEDLEPGAYLVTQTAAPPGYAEAPPFPVVLSSGFATTLTFTNLRAVGTIEISLSDTSDPPKPLPGGEFAVWADDGNGVLGAADVVLTRCTTGADGTCGAIEAPLGAYVVHQVSAPGGLAPADDAAFALTDPGQTATLAFVNGVPEVLSAESTPWDTGSSGSVELSDASLPIPIVSTVPIAPPSVARSPIAVLASLPADALAFLIRSPGQAAMFAGMWCLFLAPAHLAARRRKVSLAKEGN